MNFTKSLNNLKNKSIEEVTNFYSSGKDIIDFGTIYYYLKKIPIDELQANIQKILVKLQKMEVIVMIKKSFYLKCRKYGIDLENRLVKLKEIKRNDKNSEITELFF